MSKTDQLVATLREIGLSENEAKLYLGMLSLSEATVQKISKSSNIKRTTAYPLLEKLVRLGLVGIKEVGLRKYYFAESPARLKSLIERKKDEF